MRRNAVLIVIVGLATLIAASLIPPLPLPPRLQLFGFAAVQFVVLLFVPLLFARFALGLEPAEIGLTLGEPRRWLRDVGVLALVALPVLVALSRVPSIRAYYPVYSYARNEPWLLIPSTLAFGAYGFAWEFLFRGFLQLGTRPALGLASLLVQWLPFVIAHAGKPGVEIAGTMLSGLLLGALAHRHSSILPAWLLHLGCSTAVNLLCLLP
jgi:membrane protease YdiL (CAAX protease family)